MVFWSTGTKDEKDAARTKPADRKLNKERNHMAPYSDYINNPVSTDQVHFSQDDYSDGQLNMRHPCGLPAMIHINVKAVKGPPNEKHAKKIKVPEQSTHDHQDDARANRSNNASMRRKLRKLSIERISRDTKLKKIARSREAAETSDRRLKRAYMETKFSSLDFLLGCQVEEDEWEIESRDTSFVSTGSNYSEQMLRGEVREPAPRS
jgi:hypothetical protein